MTKLEASEIEKNVRDILQTKTKEEYLALRMEFGKKYMADEEIDVNDKVFGDWYQAHPEEYKAVMKHLEVDLGVTNEDIEKTNEAINPTVNPPDGMSAELKSLLARLAEEEGDSEDD